MREIEREGEIENDREGKREREIEKEREGRGSESKIENERLRMRD
jgi:hypothetical protein